MQIGFRAWRFESLQCAEIIRTEKRTLTTLQRLPRRYVEERVYMVSGVRRRIIFATRTLTRQ